MMTDKNILLKRLSNCLRSFANYICKYWKKLLVGFGIGVAVTTTFEEMSKSKERKAQQEKDLMYKEILIKGQAKIDAVCKENTEYKKILTDIVNYNSEANQ